MEGLSRLGVKCEAQEEGKKPTRQKKKKKKKKKKKNTLGGLKLMSA